MAEMDRTVETTGPDIEAAIAAGLEELHVDRDAVEVQVLDEGSRGVFGLGARDARVRLAVRPQPTQPAPQEAAPPAESTSKPVTPSETEAPDAAPTVTEPDAAEPEQVEMEDSEAEIARGALQELLTLLDMQDVRIDMRRAETAPGERDAPIILDVTGQDAQALVGRRGETLAALQHITRLIVGQETASRANFVLDADGYKARREQTLHRLAERLAEQAVRTNRRVVLEPMPPNERRIVHLTLRDDPRVTTESIGERDHRKVTIIPTHE